MFYAFLGGVEMDGSSMFNEMFSSGKEIERIPRESVLTKNFFIHNHGNQALFGEAPQAF